MKLLPEIIINQAFDYVVDLVGNLMSRIFSIDTVEKAHSQIRIMRITKMG